MRAPARTSVAPLARAIASGRASTSAKRGATRTRSEKPITFIARAAAPTLPAWLVPTRMKRVGSAGHAAEPLKCVSLILQRARMRPRLSRRRPPPKATRSHVPSAAPHAQHRHQGGPHRRGDHQPRFARPRAAAGELEGAERLRHRGRPRRRGGDHRHAARRPIPATASSPRSRERRAARATASTSGSSTRSTARPTSSTACRRTRSRSASPFATRSSRRSSTTRRATTSSSRRRAAAPSSTTSGCASRSGRAWPTR